MGIHLIPLAALHLTSGGGGGGARVVATPRILGTLIWPYLLKLCLSFKVSPHGMITSSRFLVFQLTQILAHGNQTGSDSNTRLDRAIRLVRERVAQAREAQRHFPSNGEDNLHLLSMLSL
ncbi:hypothetical protein vseg_006395 [Gypsophila vaccaria]